MARFRRTVVGVHHDALNTRARQHFIEARGDVEARFRAMEIGALPVVEWRGKSLRAWRCHGTSGKGSHPVNLPEWVLWLLIDLRAYRCPYHAADFVGWPDMDERR